MTFIGTWLPRIATWLAMWWDVYSMSYLWTFWLEEDFWLTIAVVCEVTSTVLLFV